MSMFIIKFKIGFNGFKLDSKFLNNKFVIFFIKRFFIKLLCFELVVVFLDDEFLDVLFCLIELLLLFLNKFDWLLFLLLKECFFDLYFFVFVMFELLWISDLLIGENIIVNVINVVNNFFIIVFFLLND